MCARRHGRAGGASHEARTGGFTYWSDLAGSKPVVCNAIVLLDPQLNDKRELRTVQSLRSTVGHEYVIHCGIRDRITAFDRNRFFTSSRNALNTST